jgi:hypothetical protein
LKARKNLDPSSEKGNVTHPSLFHNLDDSCLLATADLIGVSLGNNAHAVSLSLIALKI